MKTAIFLGMTASMALGFMLCLVINQEAIGKYDPAQKLNISIPLTDTTFIHEKDNAFYVITVSPLDVNNIPKETEQ